MTDEHNKQADPYEMAIEIARPLVRSGFETFAYIMQCVTECLEDEFDQIDNLNSIAQSVIETEIEKLQSEQQNWTHPTDCERFDKAFEELKSNGILAQHHYSCCQTCGISEIDLELEYLKSIQKPYRGYAFYHVQDTESAILGYNQCLSYGHTDDDPDDCVVIGHEICDTLNRHGLKTNWNGEFSNRIFVEMDWKRPWPPQTPDVVPQAALDIYQQSTNKKTQAQSNKFITRLKNFFR